MEEKRKERKEKLYIHICVYINIYKIDNYVYLTVELFFSEWLYHFALSLELCETASSSALLTTIAIEILVNCRHFNRCVMLTHHGFQLHFPNE